MDPNLCLSPLSFAFPHLRGHVGLSFLKVVGLSLESKLPRVGEFYLFLFVVPGTHKA